MEQYEMAQIQQAKLLAKSKNVKYLKVEFEALVVPTKYGGDFLGAEGLECTRKGCKNGKISEPCPRCDGRRKIGGKRCWSCKGSGLSDDETSRIDCPDCDGYGMTPHPDGNLVEAYLTTFKGVFRKLARSQLDLIDQRYQDCISYSGASIDLSAGTELTLTVPIEKVEVLEPLMRAFCTTCDRFGRNPANDEECITRAGLHMTFLWYRKYPTRRKLSSTALASFRENTRKLFLALIYLGSAGCRTRSLDFRSPDSGEDINYHDDSCIEFRTFDPCYNEPSKILENFLYMTRLLEFFEEVPLEWVRLRESDIFNSLSRVDGRFDYWGLKRLHEFFSPGEMRERLLEEVRYFIDTPFATERARRAHATVSAWR